MQITYKIEKREHTYDPYGLECMLAFLHCDRIAAAVDILTENGQVSSVYKIVVLQLFPSWIHAYAGNFRCNRSPHPVATAFALGERSAV